MHIFQDKRRLDLLVTLKIDGVTGQVLDLEQLGSLSVLLTLGLQLGLGLDFGPLGRREVLVVVNSRAVLKIETLALARGGLGLAGGGLRRVTAIGASLLANLLEVLARGMLAKW